MKLTLLSALPAILLLASAVPASARDRFVYDPTPKTTPKTGGKPAAGSSGKPAPAAPRNDAQAVIASGETREVFNSASMPDMAFYVPETQPTIVQVIVEKKFLKKPVYLVRGIRPGVAVGGLVPRALLDKSGFHPNNIVDAAQVQAALKTRPITILVR